MKQEKFLDIPRSPHFSVSKWWESSLETDLEELNDEELKTSLKNMRKKLFEYRDKSEHETKEMLNEAYKNYDPYKVVLLKDEKSQKDNIQEVCPILKDKEKVNNKITAYVCKNHTCKAPVTSYEELSKLL